MYVQDFDARGLALEPRKTDDKNALQSTLNGRQPAASDLLVWFLFLREVPSKGWCCLSSYMKAN